MLRREHGICSSGSSQTIRKVQAGKQPHIYSVEQGYRFADAPIGLYCGYLQVCRALRQEGTSLDVLEALPF